MGDRRFRFQRALLPAPIMVCLTLAGFGPAAALNGELVAGADVAPTGAAPITGAAAVASKVLSGLSGSPHGHGKLDSALSAVAAAAGRSRAAGLAAARAGGVRTSAGRVHALLTIKTGHLEPVRAAVHGDGGEVTGVGDGGRLVQAFVPPGRLRQLARDPGVVSIRRPPSFVPAAGTQMTQGDAALNGAAWRSAGVDGTGVKIGIIDVGFTGYTTLLRTDLPASVTVKNFVDGQSDAQVNGTTPHGTACAEIIHDVAPGAQLYFAKVAQIVDIEEAADWLEAQGVEVISSSIGTYNVSPGDGTGYFEDIIAEKRAAGITWFTAASNDRESHWGGTANIGAFDYHLFSGEQNVNYFGPGDGLAYVISAGFTFDINVRWSDWTAPVDQDFDIILVRWSGTAWQTMGQLGGFDDQTGLAGQRPVETAVGTTTGSSTFYGFVVHRRSASEAVNFEIFAGVPLDKRVQERSLSNLADSASAITVAALDVTTFTQEPYSSEGPTNGPGGTLTGGQVKPDISAFANVNTVSYGSGSGKFNGTSSATPHAAAAGALALAANPAFTPDDLELFLAGRAVDQGTPGPDTDFGHGRVQLGNPPLAPESAPPTVGLPDADFRTGVAVAKTSTPVKVRVDFTASDASGIASTELQQQVGSAAFASVSLSSPAALSADLSVATSSTTLRRLRARATDTAINTSGYATGPLFKVRAFQNGSAAIVQSGTWKVSSSSSFYGGSVRRSGSAGAQQSLTATMQDVAIVSTRGPNRGIAQVWLDGALVATFDLYSPTTQYRRVVWAADFATAASHTVVLRVTGTKNPASSAKRVDLDAYLVMQP